MARPDRARSDDQAEPEGELLVCADARTAVADAQFVQESVPERIEVKHRLYAEIEPALAENAIVASSASGLTLTELQAGWDRPDRLVLGHPFNPPHLIPLVEVMGNDRTGTGAVDRARHFYESVGKVLIEVKREVPGHVANRLQAALWREVIHLVNEGVASVDDIDTAIATGPGLRWAAWGPTTLFHLGAGEGGIAAFCERYADKSSVSSSRSSGTYCSTSASPTTGRDWNCWSRGARGSSPASWTPAARVLITSPSSYRTCVRRWRRPVRSA